MIFKYQEQLLSLLKSEYLKEDTSLNFIEFDNPFQILILTILSAQTTDKNVNKVRPALFAKYPDCKALAAADQKDVEELIKITGFYHMKAKNIIATSKLLCENFNCEVPKTIKELTTLSGVGRKTANIVLLHAYSINEGIAVDTHVKRLSYRIGLSDSNKPEVVEKDLISLFPKSEWECLNFLLISHGRNVCKAIKPECERCMISKICEKRI